MRWKGTLGAAALVAASVPTALWLGGERTFVTHPVSALALGGAAVLVADRALSLSLVGYLALGALASATPGPVTAGAWSVAWVFPTVLPAALGLRLVGRDRAARALLCLTAALAVAGALLVEPVVPFQGVATAAPEGWRAAGAVDGLLLAWYAALVVAVVVCARARSAHSTRATAVASAAPCLVVTCLALAVLRDPGEVDPGTGSVAYLVAVAVTAVVATAPWALRGVAALWALDLVVLGGVVAVGALPVTLAVVVVAALTLVTAVVAVAVVARLERPVALPDAAPVPCVGGPVGVPGLSPRENDVLAGVAAGLTNAGVAAELFVSERTVEQHLRSVFDKLDLGDHGATNRRVRAAAVWWSHQPAGFTGA